MVSKGDGVETKPAERKDQLVRKGGDYKGFESVEKIQVRYGIFQSHGMDETTESMKAAS